MSKPHCLPVAAVVLAAGRAARMGQLKQLLPFGGRTLVEHAVAQAMEARFEPVIVVVGAEAHAVRAVLAAAPVSIVENPRWNFGMGSSIAAGVEHLREIDSAVSAVAILLADQPLVTAKHLTEMRRLLHTTRAPAVAAQYAGTLGVPALFKRELFSMLQALAPGAGARQLLRDPRVEAAGFPLPEAEIDIDTPEDFRLLEHSRTATS